MKFWVFRPRLYILRLNRTWHSTKQWSGIMCTGVQISILPHVLATGVRSSFMAWKGLMRTILSVRQMAEHFFATMILAKCIGVFGVLSWLKHFPPIDIPWQCTAEYGWLAGIILWKRPANKRQRCIVKPRSHCADLAVPISTIWKIVDIGMVGSWSRGNIVLTSWKSARSGNDRQWSGSQYDKVLL